MNVRASSLILSLAIGLVGAGPQIAAAESGIGERAAALITSYMRQAGNPSDRNAAMSVAIGRDGTLLYADGFGQSAPGVRATAATIYMVGSITKQFTAGAILRLMEKGATIKGRGSEKLETTTPVADVLDVARHWNLEGGPAITIANLLSMTSNLPNYTRRPPHELDPWGAVPAPRLLAGLKEYRPSGYPGSFEYSNTSYFLLSEIMESALLDGASRGYQDILRQEVFSRLDLSDTGFAGDPRIKERLATPHYYRRPRFDRPDWLKGCGDVASSVVDIYKWDKALMDGDALGADMRAVMFADAGRVDAWTYYGAGWFISHKSGVDRYFHSGTVSGYTAFNLIVRPHGGHWVSVALLTSRDGIDDLDTLADQIAALAMAH